MKKNVLITIIAVFICWKANAQLYLDLRGGYALQYPSVNLVTPITQVGNGDFNQTSDGIFSLSQLYGTNGGGINFGLSGGYYLSKNFSIELGVNYILSGRILEARTNTPTYFAEQFGRTEGVILTPGIAIHTGGEVWDIFAKVGGFVPVYGVIYSEANISDREGRLVAELLGAPQPISGFETEVRAKAKSFSNFSAGICSGLGVRRYLGSQWNLFTEINFISLTLKAKRTEYYEFEQTTLLNGNLFTQESLEDLSTFRAKIIYKDVLNNNSNNQEFNDNIDTDRPNELPAFRRSFHSVNFAFGIGYKF